jgi:peptidoglycan hydrolase-like amidase
MPAAAISLEGEFTVSSGAPVPEGCYNVSKNGGAISLIGAANLSGPQLSLSPVDPARARFTVHGITIGIEFHWERKESQTFQGALVLKPSHDGIMLINEVPIETYLASVISSEMSASSPAELLRAHAIVSRSWLLFQLTEQVPNETSPLGAPADDQIIRWYDRESHYEFDVCADDHCQRYQGITKAHSASAFEAIKATRGQVLAFAGHICDARYSKSCGGMTERYGAAWQDLTIPYLQPVYDGPGQPQGFALPLTDEANARAWIASSPRAFCNIASPELLRRVLPGFDQETRDFYRWRVEYTAEQVSELMSRRLGIEFGRISELQTVERGESGRIIKLRITGERKTVIVGKELEIRRALSPSHLYSSAFVVEQVLDQLSGKPAMFRLIGAGWGHGVGLCQIGAAAMADAGYQHADILAHYFKGAAIQALY